MTIPYKFKVPMTPDQYAALSHKLPTVAAGTVIPNGQPVDTITDNTGTLSNHDVSLSWEYDGAETLTVDVTAQHSLAAHIANDEQVQSHITKLLSQN